MAEDSVERLRISFQKSLYSLDVIQRALFKFTGTLSVEVQDSDLCYECVLRPLTRNATVDYETEQKVRNEVVDQALRARIAKETEQVRNLILAHAFSATGLQNAE